MAVYSFATPRLTGLTSTAGVSDRWGFAARGLGFYDGTGSWTPTAATPWGTSSVAFDTTQNFYGTQTGIFGVGSPDLWEGWFNNWYMVCTDNTVALVGNDKRVAIQGAGGANVDMNNYGVRFRGPQTGTAALDARSSENLVPTIWAVHQPYQNGVIGTTHWYEETDDGVGVAYDYGTSGAAPTSFFQSMTNSTTDAAVGWRPATQNYIAAPKPNSSGVIAGFNITGINNAVGFGTFTPALGSPLNEYAYLEIEFVEGEFSDPPGGGAVGQGRCRDINPISLIRSTVQAVTCPGSVYRNSSKKSRCIRGRLDNNIKSS